jgi:hypothetical protein
MKIVKWDRQKISRPGIYRDLPLEAYHGDVAIGPSISSSGLRTIFTESPAHYFVDSYLNHEREEQEDTEALTLGRAAHHLLLGEDDFSTLFVRRPDTLEGSAWQGNRTACKEWLKVQKAEGRTVLLPSQIDRIRGMAKALEKNPLVQQGILNGKTEHSLIWQDKETGIWLKWRPDNLPNDSGDCSDLKTTTHNGFDFDNDASWRRYDFQAVLGKIAFKEVLGMEMQSFSLIPVTTKPPYLCDVLTFTGADVAQGEEDLRMALRAFAHCLRTGEWFGPGGTQSDARFLVFNPRVRERAEFRRDFLKREIENQHANAEPSQADYMGTP